AVLPGLHLATGHHRNGGLLTPVTGDVMAHVLTTGALPEVGRPFAPSRFASASPEAGQRSPPEAPAPAPQEQPV
ncbi:glycine oxidase ThiO, partial [Streptomyces sp. JAC128]